MPVKSTGYAVAGLLSLIFASLDDSGLVVVVVVSPVDFSLLLPGDPGRSLLWQRMRKRGEGQMPHIASNVVDDEAVRLVGEWIRSMKKE